MGRYYQLFKPVTKDDAYVEVMNRVVNICRRIGGCELSFYRFNVK